MTSVSKKRFGFSTTRVYRRKEPHAFQYLSERATFWIAVISVFAFVTGNMIGQHGWSVFWKSVMGEGSENTIVFTGMVPPVAKVPDYEKWGRLGGDPRVHTFREVPTDLLVPLPTYIRHGETSDADPSLRRVFFVEHLGTYENGRGKGSHVGVDISLPEGTPVQSVANGVVVRSSYDAGGFGNFVVVKHPNVPNIDEQGKKSAVYSVYAHLSSALVTEGTVVQKGEQIGLSGHTGNATAPHLHFQMDRDTAPFHPYWPFTSSEQRSAGLSFVQAIDKGLDRENGVNFTVDSMLTVQAYSWSSRL
jgi:murein DD-endopeptidase MepM/ murein hydrolase activator NlpD